ncbi:uncharacterized protein YlxW (UPF0749 family) [Antricoccus suffuscus]|uniref:Uncharacterized protein YlxW (UPF0749 family) n=1 Tax=Antricoccus suffuscus TaxID=1629062 RepID=A0A2T0ZWV0_9ACTN|nr:DUF881 domain-containing protein [Antricoccus suffuscus]PRZ40813.1 uncharacterized protein YlxW (UPF0749 family) [Antricoccus suffuscus]
MSEDSRDDTNPDPDEHALEESAADNSAADDSAADHSADETISEDSARTTRRSAKLGSRAGIAIGILCVLLGFAVAVQVRQNSAAGQNLAGARQEDLVRILSDLDGREQRLQGEITDLKNTQQDLSSGGDKAQAAEQQAQKKAAQLAILAGTVGATGPGITLHITDPKSALSPDVMLNVIQELRAAGAEAIQVGTVRIGVTSAITGGDGAVVVDGSPVKMPVDVLAIGDPATIGAAMSIPGGVVSSVKLVGGVVTVTQSGKIDITALRDPQKPDYAEPAGPSK